MRKIACLFAFCLTRAIFACDPPRGVPINDLHYTTQCGMSDAALAANDDGAFAAWHSYSRVTPPANFGVPLDAIGRPTAPAGFSFNGFEARPFVATDGHDFLLVLADASLPDIATIVHPNGSSEPFQSLPALAAQGPVGVVWTGSDYLVVDPDLNAVHVTRDGKITNVNMLTTGAKFAALAPGLVIWKRGTSVEAAPLDGGPAVLIPAPSNAAFTLARGSDGYLVAFTDVTGRAAALRLDLTGHPAAAPIELTNLGPSIFPVAPVVAFDGDSFLALWSDSNLMRAMRIGADGSALSRFVIGPGVITSAATSRDGTLIAYASACEAIATRVIPRSTSTANSESTVSFRGLLQYPSSVAATATGHQAIWNEEGALYTRSIGSSGPAGPRMKLPLELGNMTSAIISYAGGTVVAYDDTGFPTNTGRVDHIRVVRLGTHGELVAQTIIPSSYFTSKIVLAASGNDVLVVLSGNDPTPFSQTIMATRLDSNLTPLQSVVLAQPGEYAYDPVVAADGSRWHVAWLNDQGQFAAVDIPHDELRQQTRFSAPAPPLSTNAGLTSGDDPAIVWTGGSPSRVHATFYHSGVDVVLSEPFPAEARVIGNEAFWLTGGDASVHVRSALVTKTPAAASIERACLGNVPLPLAFDVREGALDAITYLDGLQLHVLLHGVARRHGPS
jgi:hypothetical protein